MAKTALVVDDAQLVRTKLREFLEGEGFTVFEAEHGRDGVDFMQKSPDVDIVVTDLNMPLVDGMELTRQIRTIEKFKKIPIFVLSTESTPELKKKGKESGVTAWILKPFNPQSMRDVMKALKLY